MSDCETILRKAKVLRFDECEVVSVHRKITTVRITDSEVAEIKQNVDNSIAVRGIYQKKIVSSRTSDPNDSTILDKTLQTLPFVQPKEFWKSLPSQARVPKLEKTFDKKLDEITGSGVVDIAERMICSASHQKITSISGSLNIVSEKFELVNSNGLNCSDISTYIAGIINTDSNESSVPISGIGASSSRTTDSFNPESIGSDSREMCLKSINPKTCETKSYSIIFEPYAIGEMLAFVFASNFNLKIYSEKRSCFEGKLGTKIASEIFSLIDDPHSPEGIGTKPFDDEGSPTSIRYFIESGLFSGTYSDSFHAFKEDQQSTGNASRMGSPMGRTAQPIPLPSPHNLRIKEGEFERDEIIKETKDGLLVGRLWYTYAVNPERGDFSCTARSGIQIIQDGKIVGPGKMVRIVHNLPVLLQNVSSIGKDSRNVLNWHALPCITPTIKVDNIKAVSI